MYQKKRVLVVVPARGGSKGIRLKNLISIGGQTLVGRVGSLVQQLDYIDRCVCSTDHPEIAETAKKAGIEVPFWRPADLSGDSISDTAVLTHALLEVERQGDTPYDIVLMLQPTSPFREPEHVTQVCKKLVIGGFDSVLTVSPSDTKTHPLKQLVFQSDKLSYYDEVGKEIIARQQLSTLYHRNGVAYGMTRECLLVQETTIGKLASAVVIDQKMPNIDTDEDVRYAEYIYALDQDAEL